MPKLISFDIGIKNLAYCIFEFSFSPPVDTDKSSVAVKIIDWNVLDISKHETIEGEKKKDDIFCSCILSKKTKTKTEINKCKKKAKYYRMEDYFCESHAKTSGFFFPLKEFSHSSLKKLSLEKLLEIEDKYFFVEKKEKEIPIKKETKIEKIERISRQFQQKSLVSISNLDSLAKKPKSIDLISIGRNLSNQLLSLEHLEDIEFVLIENQISPIANKMKTIQGMLAQLFIMRNVPHIEFVSSINKLRGFLREKSKDQDKDQETDKDQEITKTNPNPNYKQHKKDGILYCQQWLKNDLFCSWNPFFETYPKKQDDLADSFLQGIWYFQKTGVIC